MPFEMDSKCLTKQVKQKKVALIEKRWENKANKGEKIELEIRVSIEFWSSSPSFCM